MAIMLAYKFVWQMSPVPIKPKTETPLAYRVPLGALVQNINSADVIPEFNAVKAAAETATQTATDASITSADALQRASQAQEQVVGAAVSADQALDAASVAQTAAATAAINAGQAQSDAAQAQTAAAQVLTTALNAETTANAASLAATDAQTLAHTAAIDAAAAAGQVAGAVADLPLVKSQVEIALLGTKPFATKPLMQAFVPGVNDPKVALVGNDPTPANRGYYYWDAAANAGAGDWIKSPYDPSAAADTAAAEVLPTAGIYQNGFGGITVTDVKGNPIMFTTAAGLLYAVTLQGYTSLEQIGKLLGVANTFDPAEQLLLLTDGKYNPILFQTVGGLLHAPTLQNVVRPDDIGGLLMLGEAMSPDETMQMLVRDRKFSPAIFATPDSRVYIPNLQGYASLADIANIGGGGNRYKGAVIWHIFYGQSNNLGSGATSSSTTPSSRHFKLNKPRNNVRHGDPEYPAPGSQQLVGGCEVTQETPTSATINELLRRLTAENRVPVDDMLMAGTCSGNGGTTFAKLSKGHPDGWFDHLVAEVTDTLALLAATGKAVVFGSLNITEGEADTEDETSKADYMSLQRGFYADFAESIYTLTGQLFNGPLVFNQCCAMRSYVHDTLPTSFRIPNVQRAQLEMGLTDPQMLCAFPDYILERRWIADQSKFDHVHFNAYCQTVHAAYKARALKYWEDGRKWLPLHITKCEWYSSYILLTYYVPFGRLQFDTSVVAAVPNQGFDVWRTTETDPYCEPVLDAITGLTLVGTNQLRIDLAANYPAGHFLTYAWGRFDDQIESAGPLRGPRGALRDTHGLIDKYTPPPAAGSTVWDMHNWAVVQDFTRT